MTATRRVETAAAVIIGSEILSGKIQDEKSYSLATFLRPMGIELRRLVVVPDEREIISGALRELHGSVDLVVTSGGVGPTHDDVTMAAIADFFGDDLVENPRLAALLRSVYGDRLTDNHLRMALLPRRAEVIETPEALWPLIAVDSIFAFPGVPDLFRAKLRGLRTILSGKRPYFSAELVVLLEEVDLKDELDRVVAEYPDVAIGSYPQFGKASQSTRITFDGRREESVKSAHRALTAALRDSIAGE